MLTSLCSLESSYRLEFHQIMSFTVVIIIDYMDLCWINENHTVYLIKLMHEYTHIYGVKPGFMSVLGVFCHVCKFK